MITKSDREKLGLERYYESAEYVRIEDYNAILTFVDWMRGKSAHADDCAGAHECDCQLLPTTDGGEHD